MCKNASVRSCRGFPTVTMASLKVMKAIRVSEFGAPSVLKFSSEFPVPAPGPKQVKLLFYTHLYLDLLPLLHNHLIGII